MKKKILWLSDSCTLTTGYANISTQICNRLAAAGWEVHYIGHNYLGQTLKPGVTFLDDTKLDFTLYGNGKEQFGKDIIQHRIREIQPHVFCVLLDTFMVFPWFIEKDYAPARTVFYFPSDGGGGLPLGCENILRKVTAPVAMSKFAQKQALEVHGIKTNYIPHAVDSTVYKPLSAEEKLKCKARFGLLNKFVVGCVARNQGRKMLDGLIKAFVPFCKDKPDAVILFHTDPEDNAASFDIWNLIVRNNLQNRVVFTGTKYYKGFDYLEMNQVYNAMDLFVLPTSGEGWGVPITEAMACEIPVLVTDYTTTPEMVTEHGSGGAIKIVAEITGSWNVERAIIDRDELSLMMTNYYNDSAWRLEAGKKGREAVLKYYDWPVVMKQWESLLDTLVVR